MKFAFATEALRGFHQALCHPAVAGCAVCAVAFGAESSAQAQFPVAQQPLQVIASDLKGNHIDSLSLSPGITSATSLNTDGSSYLLFDSLALVPNQPASSSTTSPGALDIVASATAKDELVLYSASNSFSSGQVIYPNNSCSKKAAGLAYPTRIAADAAGNLFVVSLNPRLIGAPSLWVLPINNAGGNCIYGNPILIDSTFTGVKPNLIAEVVVAGSAAAPTAAVPTQFTASISGTMMTVTAVINGYLASNSTDVISGTGVISGTTITGQTSGTPGAAGMYTVSIAQDVSSETMTGLGSLWNAGDILVLDGDLLNPQVLVYARAKIIGTKGNFSGPQLPLTAPTSIAVSRSAFVNELGSRDVPLSMDLWPGDPTQTTPTGVGLLFSTLAGRIVRFDSATNEFITAADFAKGSELIGLSRMRVGSYLNTPYVFVTKPGLLGKGSILQFGDTQTGTSNVPQSFSTNVSNPYALAVTTSSSTSASSCEPNNPSAPGCTIFPGTSPTTPELSLNIQCPMQGASASTPCPSGPILAQQCLVADPRVSFGEGGWTCSANGSTPSNLDVSTMCPVPSTILPPFLCGYSGPTNNELVVVEVSAEQADAAALNNLFVYTSDVTQVEPGVSDLTCTPDSFPAEPSLPLTAFAPRSDLLTVEGPIVEWGQGPTYAPYFIDSIGACDQSKQNNKHPSMISFGLALDQNALPFAYGPSNGTVYINYSCNEEDSTLQCFIDDKYFNLLTMLLNAASTSPPQISGGVSGAVYTKLHNDITTSQEDFDGFDYCDALNQLVTTNSDVLSNLGAFSVPAGGAPMYNINPSGEIVQRISNLYTQINNYFEAASPPASWPPADLTCGS
jgi:hypothetical protein